MAPVKVFGQAMSTSVARVLVCLEEVSAEYEVVNIDFQVKEHKSPDHLARNVRSPNYCVSSCTCIVFMPDFSPD